MKNLILASTFLLLTINIYAQDKITTTEKTVLEVEIIEVTKKNITFRSLKNQPNTFSTINLQKVLKIEYQDGTITTFKKVNPRIARPWGFGLGYFLSFDGTGAVISYTHFISPQLELGVELGTLASAFFNYTYAISGKYHFRKSESTKPLSTFLGLNVISLSNSFSTNQISIQTPVGIQYLNHNGFKYSISLVPITNFDKFDAFFEVRAGYNFKKK